MAYLLDEFADDSKQLDHLTNEVFRYAIRVV